MDFFLRAGFFLLLAGADSPLPDVTRLECRGRCRTRTVRESIHPLPAGRRQTESGPCRRERKPPTHGKLEIAFSPDFKGFQARLVDPEALGRKEMAQLVNENEDAKNESK